MLIITYTLFNNYTCIRVYEAQELSWLGSWISTDITKETYYFLASSKCPSKNCYIIHTECSRKRRSSFSGFWHCHSYILQHLNENVFTLCFYVPVIGSHVSPCSMYQVTCTMGLVVTCCIISRVSHTQDPTCVNSKPGNEEVASACHIHSIH